MIGARWGVSERETLRSYPCDGFAASPLLQAWRGVSVGLPPEAVWPWVASLHGSLGYLSPLSSKPPTTTEPRM